MNVDLKNEVYPIRKRYDYFIINVSIIVWNL
jgi:hypothetical protein